MGYYGRPPLGEIIYTDMCTERSASADAAAGSGEVLRSDGGADEDGLQAWHFLGSGSYNYAYLDCANRSKVLKISKYQKFGEEVATIRQWLDKIAHDRIEFSAVEEYSDDPNRLKRIEEDDGATSVNDFNIEVRMVNITDESRTRTISVLATVSPFIPGPPANDLDRALLVLKFYEKTRRVIVDAPSSSNVICDERTNRAVCVDTGFALRRKSVVSEKVWRYNKEEFQNRYWPNCGAGSNKPITVWVCRWLMAIEFENRQVSALPELFGGHAQLLSKVGSRIIHLTYNYLTNQDRIKLRDVIDLIRDFHCPLETLAFCLQYSSAVVDRELFNRASQKDAAMPVESHRTEAQRAEVQRAEVQRIKEQHIEAQAHRNDSLVALAWTYRELALGGAGLNSSLRSLVELLSNFDQHYSSIVPNYTQAIKPIIDIGKRCVSDYLEHDQDDSRWCSGSSSGSDSSPSPEVVASAFAGFESMTPAGSGPEEQETNEQEENGYDGPSC